MQRHAKICGTNEIKVKGFMPQSFEQNEDTYKALDELGFEYNAGFQEGILYAPGHEEDVWPYKVDNHKFYAVPVSTYMFSGELVPLYDRYAKDSGISASQWKDMLIGKFNEISGKDEPMVISLSSPVSGSGEYLEAFKEFMSFASSKNAQFVVTRDLVNMSRTGIHRSLRTVASEVISQNTRRSWMPTECEEAAKKAEQNNASSNETEEIILEM